MKQPTVEELQRGLDNIRQSPADAGPVLMIVRRPGVGEREVLHQAELDPGVGMVGDTWHLRPSSSSPDGGPHPEKNLTIMNSRAAGLVAGDQSRWALAGDQLYVDLDLSLHNLPPGTQLAIGTAVVEITAPPHTGCAKFVERFGVEAMKFVNSALGRLLNLRGVNARVVQAGTVRLGDIVHKML